MKMISISIEEYQKLDRALDERDRFKKALEEIAEMRNKTLLSRCCVDNTCITDEEGTDCEVQLKVHLAFVLAADVAEISLAAPSTREPECDEKEKLND